MRLAAAILVPALAAGCWGQAITQEGDYWIQTTTGTIGLAGRGRLEVGASGPVIVQGGERQAASYVLRKRVRARDAEAARRLLGQIALIEGTSGGGVTFMVRPPAGGGPSTSLHLDVPRALDRVSVNSQEGALEFYDLDGAVMAKSHGGRIQMDRIRGDVVVHTMGGPVRFGEMGGNVKCFSGGGPIVANTIAGEAGLNTAGGEISIRWAKGPVHASTSGGSVRIERADGEVEATVRAGLIDIVRAGGAVTANTESAAIKVRSAGAVDCQTQSGAIHLAGIHGGMKAATRTGSIVAELARKLSQSSTLTTGSGDITLLIPSNLPVTVQATGAHGEYPGPPRVISDFAETRGRDLRDGSGIAINGGGPLVRLTASGTIYLRRQK